MEEDEGYNEKKQTRKRARNPAEWKREKRKRLRIAGKSYVNSRGDIVNERKIGADCKCRRKCYSRVPEEMRNKLFDGYYSLNSHDEQNAYLFGLIRKHDIARKRCKESDRRTCSYKYYVRTRGKEIQICRLAFANIHGISPHKIRILCQKQDQNVMYPRDGRGKHNNRPRKIPNDTLHGIKEHIYSILSSDRVCEFLREEKHIGPDVNITKMWKDYLQKYDPHYREIFSEVEIGDSTNSKIDGSHVETECSLNVFPLNDSELIDDPESHQFPTTMELIEYPISPVGDSLELLEHPSDSQFSDTTMPDESNVGIEKKPKYAPIVKHWLYSKVFHDEFRINDFVTLKKKLISMKDISKSPSNTQGNKSERKQRTPKKITREKELRLRGSLEESCVINPSSLNYSGILDVTSNNLQNISSGQNTDMFTIVPLNLPEIAPIPHASEIPTQQHTMQFNLHSLPTQSSVLSPIVNMSNPAQAIQCSSVVTLPASSVSFAPNSCSYVNLNMAAFY